MDIGEVLDLVARRARVAVDALVLAAPVQVHVVLQPKVGVGLLYMVENGFAVDFFDHDKSNQVGARYIVPQPDYSNIETLMGFRYLHSTWLDYLVYSREYVDNHYRDG